MKRIERLTAILTQMQAKRVVAAREIAGRFGVSLRTVYRDIRALEEAGVPLGAEAGKGYFLAEGYSLPPVAFTTGEAAALVTAGKLLEGLAGEPIAEQCRSAAYKVMAVLSADQKEYAETLQSRFGVFCSGPPCRFLPEILACVCGGRVAAVRYGARAGQPPTERKVEPLALYFHGVRWYLFAYCRERKGFRSFRADRIMEFVVTGERFHRGDGSAAHQKTMGRLGGHSLRPAGA